MGHGYLLCWPGLRFTQIGAYDPGGAWDGSHKHFERKRRGVPKRYHANFFGAQLRFHTNIFTRHTGTFDQSHKHFYVSHKHV